MKNKKEELISSSDRFGIVACSRIPEPCIYCKSNFMKVVKNTEGLGHVRLKCPSCGAQTCAGFASKLTADYKLLISSKSKVDFTSTKKFDENLLKSEIKVGIASVEFINRNDRCPTMDELAKLTKFSRSTCNRIITTLEKNGHLVRSDRRNSEWEFKTLFERS